MHRHCQQVYNNLPHQLRSSSDNRTPKDTESKFLIGQAYILLNYLQIQFLIDRLAITRGLPNEQGLLNTAMQMMEVTMMFWVKRDQLMNFSSSFDWIVSICFSNRPPKILLTEQITCYGIPSIGVICVELVRQSSGHNALQFSRPEAIQKLTMFTSFLDWVRPTDSSDPLVGKLKGVIRKTLDHVLDPAASQKSTSERIHGYPDRSDVSSLR